MRTGGDLGSRKEPRSSAPPTLSEVLELPAQAFKNPKQVGMLCAVARKLNYALSDEESLNASMPWNTLDEKPLLDRLLLAEEQNSGDATARLQPPPKKPRAPRAEGVVERTTETGSAIVRRASVDCTSVRRYLKLLRLRS